MKARIKGTGKIVDVDYIEGDYLHTSDGLYLIAELEGIESDIDYWTRLEHQAAIAAMQGLMTKDNFGNSREEIVNRIADYAIDVAHALVEKYKKEEE